MVARRLQRDIARGEYIGMSRRCKQVDFRGPWSDARNRREGSHRFIAAARSDAFEVKPLLHGRRYGEQRFLLRAGQAGFPEKRIACRQNCGRRQWIEQPGEPSEYRGGAGGRNLLRHHDSGDAAEPRRIHAERNLSRDIAHGVQPRVGLAQCFESFPDVFERCDASHGTFPLRIPCTINGGMHGTIRFWQQ